MNSTWNYEKDLELLKQKISTCPPLEKHKIQRIVTEMLEVSFADDGEPARNSIISTTKDCSKEKQESLESITLASDSLDLDPEQILNVIRLLYQFRKDYKGTRKLLEENEIENTVAFKLFQATSWAQLTSLWQVLSIYRQKIVDLNETKLCPLEVDLVLRKIFGYIPTKDLWNCRVVSRAWNQKIMQWEFSKRKECALTLSCNVIAEISSSNISSPSIFHQLNLHPTGIPIEECYSFFTQYGTYVKRLKLHAENLEDIDEPTEDNDDDWGDEDIAVGNMPKTSSLFEVIHKLRTIFQNVNQMHELEILDLPRSLLKQPFIFTDQELRQYTLPNVRSLALNVNSDFSRQFAEGFFSMLHNVNSLRIVYNIPTEECQQVLDGTQKLNLTSLSLTCTTNAQPNLWRSWQPQHLQILKTDVYVGSEEHVHSFEDFIERQSHTLTSFTLENVFLAPTPIGVVPIRRIQLPIMKNLETLAFEFLGNSNFLVPISPQQLPKLRNLSFDIRETSKFFLDRTFSTVQELSSTAQNVAGLEGRDWRSLGSRFPNARKLTLKLGHGYGNILGNQNAASEIFRCFPNSEDLHLSVEVGHQGDNSINRLLSGLESEGEFILSQLLITMKSPEELMEVAPVHGSLRDMKKLKKLVLRLTAPNAWDEDERPLIDSIGVQFGLMSVRPLDELSILGDFKISEEGAALLNNYHRIVILSPALSAALPSDQVAQMWGDNDDWS